MSIQVTWDNEEQTVISYTSLGKWTWDEFYAAIDQVCVMARDVGYPVAVIMDLRKSIPPTGNALLHFQNAMKRSPANISEFVYVGAVGFKRVLISMASKVMFAKSSMRFLFADSLEDAHLMVIQERAKYSQRLPEI